MHGATPHATWPKPNVDSEDDSKHASKCAYASCDFSSIGSYVIHRVYYNTRISTQV